jgi:ADP-ribose pyrophosphatase
MILAMHEMVDVRTSHRGRLLSVEVLSWTDDKGRHVEREVVRHPGAVLVVPLLDGDRIVMVRNFRVAAGKRLLELPAGTLEANEDPQRAAGRELEEETGYRPARVTRLGEFYTSPGFCDELMRVFVADGLKMVGQRLEPGEQIDVEVVTRSDALAMIDDGRIADGKTIAGLLMWLRREGDARA